MERKQRRGWPGQENGPFPPPRPTLKDDAVGRLQEGPAGVLGQLLDVLAALGLVVLDLVVLWRRQSASTWYRTRPRVCGHACTERHRVPPQPPGEVMREVEPFP